MRKRIVIGAIAGIVVGVVVYVVTEPAKKSIEWHKREYSATIDRLAARTWRNKIRRVCGLIVQGKPWERSQDERFALVEKLRHHENMLVALGFLEAREIAHEGYTNRVGDETVVGLPRIHKRTHQAEIFDPNGLTRRYETMSQYARAIPSGFMTIVIGVPDDIPKWETIIRKEDAQWHSAR